MHTLFEPTWPARREGSSLKKILTFIKMPPPFHPRHCAPSRKNHTGSTWRTLRSALDPHHARNVVIQAGRRFIHIQGGFVVREASKEEGEFALTTATQRGVAIKAGFVWLLVFSLNTCFSGGARLTLGMKVGAPTSF